MSGNLGPDFVDTAGMLAEPIKSHCVYFHICFTKYGGYRVG